MPQGPAHRPLSLFGFLINGKLWHSQSAGHREPEKVHARDSGHKCVAPVSYSVEFPQHQHIPPHFIHTQTSLCLLFSCPGGELRLREVKQLGELLTGLLRTLDEKMYVKQTL